MSFGNVVIGPNGQVSLQGLESGVQTDQIIQALLTPYTDQINAVKNEQSAYSTQVTDWQAINTDLATLQSAAQTLASPFNWQAATATSSNTSVASATASTGTPQGSVSFTVSSLASNDSWLSSGSVASTGTVVDSNPGYLLSQASQYGFTSLVAGSGLSIGSHSFNVTQSLSAASTTSSSVTSGSTTITSGTNDTLSVKVNGTTYNLTLAGGTYSPSQLASAINSAATAAGAPLTASINAGGYLVLSTNLEGSSASLQVTGGTAVSTLGLSVMSSASSGSAGSVTVDGTVNAINNVMAGSTVSLNGGAISATIGNGVGNSSGSFTATNVSTGSGTLANLVSNINAANAGVTASAIQTGGGGYVLQLSSSTTGANSDLTVDPNAFTSSGLGVMNHTSAGSDAVVNVGGSGGYSVTSQTNTISGLLPGLSVQLYSTSGSPVTISVSTNVQGLTTDVQNLVNAANTALSDLQKYGGYNSSTQTAGPLIGQEAVSSLQQAILNTFATTLGASGLSSAMAAGISVVYNNSTGQDTIQFNQAQFQTELASNPSAVQNLFAQGGTFTTTSGLTGGTVSLIAGTNNTMAGSYPVNITAVATQATDNGTGVSGSVSTPETLTFNQTGGGSANYTTTSGETFSQVVTGLNAAFAAAGLTLSASLGGSGNIVVKSDSYGSAQSFSVTSSSGTGSTGLAGTFAGTDVAGTINGVTASGSGQVLSAPMSNPTLAGLTLGVTATTTGSGTFVYQPGIAQALATVSQEFSSPVGGVITTAISGLNNASNGLNSQITFYQNLSNQQKQALTNEFAHMEASLGVLKSQGSYLQSALASLAAQGL